MEIGEGPALESQAVGVIERLGKAEPFLAVGRPFLELSLVGENPRQIGAKEHSRKAGETKSLLPQITLQQLQDVLEKLLGLSVVACPDAGRAEVEIPHDLQRNISKRLGDDLGALAERERFRRMTRLPEAMAQMYG